MWALMPIFRCLRFSEESQRWPLMMDENVAGRKTGALCDARRSIVDMVFRTFFRECWICIPHWCVWIWSALDHEEPYNSPDSILLSCSYSREESSKSSSSTKIVTYYVDESIQFLHWLITGLAFSLVYFQFVLSTQNISSVEVRPQLPWTMNNWRDDGRIRLRTRIQTHLDLIPSTCWE